MSPTVTINTGSEPGSWAYHWAMRDLAQAKALFPARTLATIIGAPAPTCAHCRAVLCGCADHIWKG